MNKNYPITMNFSYSPLYDKLLNANLGQNKVEKNLANLSDTKIFDIIQDLQGLLPSTQYSDRLPTGNFSFIANSRLSGIGGHNDLPSRLKQLDSLSRFAVLYADTVYIHEPLSERKFTSKKDNPFLKLKEDTASEIEILWAIKPLLESGILKLARNNFPIPKGIEMESTSKQINAISHSATKALKEKFGENTKFRVSYIDRNKFRMTIATGPLELIDNQSTEPGLGAIGHFNIGDTSFSISKSKIKSADELITLDITSKDESFEALFQELISPILEDLVFKTTCSLLYNLSYITDRQADYFALNTMEANSNVTLSNNFFNDFSLDVPMVFGAVYDDLLNLRANEQESFLVYRDALKKALLESKSNDPKYSTSILSDIVMPELNKIDLAIKRHKKYFTKSAGRNIVYSAGAIAVGLMTGFISPAIADAIAKIGGLKYGIDTLRDFATSFDKPKEVQENRFFFLWKANKILENYKK